MFINFDNDERDMLAAILPNKLQTDANSYTRIIKRFLVIAVCFTFLFVYLTRKLLFPGIFYSQIGTVPPIGGDPADPTSCVSSECLNYSDPLLGMLNRTNDDPCDLYEYGCGQWDDSFVIPDDKRRYLRTFHSVADANMLKIESLISAVVCDSSLIIHQEGVSPKRGWQTAIACDYQACRNLEKITNGETQLLEALKSEIPSLFLPEDHTQTSQLQHKAKMFGEAQSISVGTPLKISASSNIKTEDDVYMLKLNQNGLSLPYGFYGSDDLEAVRRRNYHFEFLAILLQKFDAVLKRNSPEEKNNISGELTPQMLKKNISLLNKTQDDPSHCHDTHPKKSGCFGPEGPLGVPPDKEFVSRIERVMEMETALQRVSLPPLEAMDPDNTNNVVTLGSLTSVNEFWLPLLVAMKDKRVLPETFEITSDLSVLVDSLEFHAGMIEVVAASPWGTIKDFVLVRALITCVCVCIARYVRIITICVILMTNNNVEIIIIIEGLNAFRYISIHYNNTHLSLLIVLLFFCI
eukprot:GHVR01166833.1.p1 GENE.GHVR01166833.1~~GHVR01166833.1.p1  ORF type:complete len:521 (-),score=70.59 GHVR01166833.1:1870-3432(-)